MKEQFGDKRLYGKIKVSCKKEIDGKNKVVAVWEARKEDIVDAVIDITNKAALTGYGISIRGIYYKLVGENLILNYQQTYQKLTKIIQDCRYSGVVDWDAVKVDGARAKQIDYSVEGVDDALDDTIRQYKLDRQEGQPNYIEVWCEKDTLVDLLRMITDKYHIPLCIAKGRQSTSAIYKAYQRFRQEITNGRPVKVLYVGDHDPDGLDMIRDVKARTLDMLQNSTLDYSQTEYHYNSTLDYKRHLQGALEVIPVALTLDQVRQYSLPPNFAKEDSACYEWYIDTFGTTECWEVDALDGEVLYGLVEHQIQELINIDLYTNIVEREKADRQALIDFINTKQ